MSLINDIYVELQNLFQKHGRGFLSADELNGGAQYVESKIIREAFNFINNIRNNEKIGRINKRNFDKEKFYNEVVRALLSSSTLSYNSTTERFAFPDDYSFLQALYYNDSEIEEIPSDERIVLVNYSTMPSLTYPLSIFHGTDIEILPDDIVSGVKMYYYREAKKPRWTYTIQNNQALFHEDANDYQDFELPRSIFDEIMVEMGLYFSLEIKQPDLAQAFNNEDKKSESLKRID